MTRWLVTGAGGMLGSDMVDVLSVAGDDVVGLTRAELDVRDAAACRDRVEGSDVVVNAAAWTDVDGAEAHEAEAFGVNAVGAANLARACSEAGAVMVQVSTDYVFSGNATAPIPVDAPVAPLNAYGRTKAAGEWAVRADCPRSYVVRTAWLYGAHGPNFVRTMLRLAGERETVDVVDDQRGQPTWTRDLAASLRQTVLGSLPFGVRHATGAGETTWWGFAREIFATAGLDPDRVRATTSQSHPRPASRPAYSVLEYDAALPAWRDALGEAMPLLLGH